MDHSEKMKRASLRYFRSKIAGSGTDEDPRHAIAIKIGSVRFLEDKGDHMIVGYEKLSEKEEALLLSTEGIEEL